MAENYASSRPPYPRLIFHLLRSEGAIGPGLQVLEFGAGSRLATRELVASGSQVVAIEPGHDLRALLAAAVPEAQIVPTGLEDASLPLGAFDSVVAATSLHWVNLAVALPKLHSALRSDGRLAVFRTIFGDDTVHTEFRDRVKQIVATREQISERTAPEARPTMAELSASGHFRPARSERWRWNIA
jgi:trans-aconitate methyltransferase